MKKTLRRTALLALLVSACSKGIELPEPPPRLRLADQALAEWTRPAKAPGGSELLDLNFVDGLPAWTPVSDPGTERFHDPERLSVETRTDSDGTRYVALGKVHGGLSRVVQVEPGAAYRLRGRVRTVNLVPSAEPFFGATLWVAELSSSGSAREVLSPGFQDQILQRHIQPTAYGHDGWREHDVVIHAGAETEALLVACAMGTSEELRGGEVHYADVRLERVPIERWWEQRVDAIIAGQYASDPRPTGWRDARLLRAGMGAEVRPSVLLFPGERLRFRVRLHPGQPTFLAGLGPWPGALEPGVHGESSLSLKVEGREALKRTYAAPARRLEARWDDVEVDLTPHAGEVVSFELSVDGDLPAVFGAARIIDRAARREGPNVILVSIDTLRADHVSSYGYGVDTTPRLDELASRSALFTDVTAQAPYTLPSHTSMFSGQLPSVHGIFTSGQVISRQRSPLLAEVLGAHGFTTQAFGAGGFLNADFGFDRGFDGFTNVDPIRPGTSDYFASLIRDHPDLLSEDIVRSFGRARIEGWLDKHRDERFFLFLHTYTVHDYDPPADRLAARCAEEGCSNQRKDYKEFLMHFDEAGRGDPSPEDARHLLHRYDAALQYVDEELGRIFEHLERLGLAQDTLVVITSDHGEEFFERGYIQHGKSLYQELVGVPLILHGPGIAAERIEHPVMVADVAPTVLARLGLPKDERMQGLDLLTELPSNRSIWSEVNDLFAHKYLLRDDDWKLIHGPLDAKIQFPNREEWELFDLASDPGERHNLATDIEAPVKRLREALQKTRSTLRDFGESLGKVGLGAVGEETRAQLQGLGYN